MIQAHWVTGSGRFDGVAAVLERAARPDRTGEFRRRPPAWPRPAASGRDPGGSPAPYLDRCGPRDFGSRPAIWLDGCRPVLSIEWLPYRITAAAAPRHRSQAVAPRILFPPRISDPACFPGGAGRLLPGAAYLVPQLREDPNMA